MIVPSLGEEFTVSPQIFDSNLVDICKTAVAEEIGESNQMYSGPLHDAVEMNKLIPTVMMFVMSKMGFLMIKTKTHLLIN